MVARFTKLLSSLSICNLNYFYISGVTKIYHGTCSCESIARYRHYMSDIMNVALRPCGHINGSHLSASERDRFGSTQIRNDKFGIPTQPISRDWSLYTP